MSLKNRIIRYILVFLLGVMTGAFLVSYFTTNVTIKKLKVKDGSIIERIL